MRFRNTKLEVEQKKSNVVRRLTIFLGGIAGVLVVVTVVVSVGYASKGSELMIVEREISKLTTENGEIEEQIVRLTSVSNLVEGIEETDFIDPENIEYLSSDLAQGQDIIAKLP
ncbi:hypothetical protein A2415_05330 [candidate division WWE3 bacterium RIFOXYC1_FULL_39_7]|uniref:Cell division protein FtsL n=1 Tax=candidate division WWE3 bacterium RIFOXYC1_FULL_39_7 TaxID=1802643 RepID=A0A1F4WJH6_UNCKA|nr:MAG: hypothetical protein A2415_05330 [candidate division WWE3 bacterium RIFOXYC1_FULL_39_7]